VKRFEILIDTIVHLRPRYPDLELVVVGEGYRREQLEAQIHGAGAERYVTLAGHVTDDEVIELYRRAWVLASASAREGWGMTVTEAAACGTPAVATRIAGHSDAVAEGTSGLLADGPEELTAALDRVLGDPALRGRLSEGAQRHAEHFTWAQTARGTLEVLAAESLRRNPRH
jgi:glycosyltransferase involved in cell wall biosynthesis